MAVAVAPANTGGPRGGESEAGGKPACSEAVTKWVRVGAMKDPVRAIEKGITCYFGDVSRLADVCRQRLAFGSPADLLNCLRAIRDEAPDVRIVRVKNGMHGDHDSWYTAGFRVRGGEARLGLSLAAECVKRVGGGQWRRVATVPVIVKNDKR